MERSRLAHVRTFVDIRWPGEPDPGPSVNEENVGVVREEGGEIVLLLDHRPITFGRVAGCDVVLPFVTLSRRHFIIAPHGGGHALFDLGSTGGTYVNQMRVPQWEPNEADRREARLLEHGDVVNLNIGVEVTIRRG